MKKIRSEINRGDKVFAQDQLIKLSNLRLVRSIDKNINASLRKSCSGERNIEVNRRSSYVACRLSLKKCQLCLSLISGKSVIINSYK